MLIIKLNAIDSTNNYLKELSSSENLENYTTVVANEQTKGRGQMGANWVSESGKNLTMSVFVKNVLLDISEIFYLNVAVALAVFKSLKAIEIDKLCIKWPNDIMADNKKIGGILIENSIKYEGDFHSIIGIGLNVNQKDFTNLPKATSLSLIKGTDFDLDELIKSILQNLEEKISILRSNKKQVLWEEYHNVLYKLGKPMAFEDFKGNQFMGIIQKIDKQGKLVLLNENDKVIEFGVKEIKMLY